MLPAGVLLLSLCQLTLAKTVTYDWSVDWVTAAPDGFSRPVIGINGQWPPPTVHINKGDRFVANVFNNLGNESLSLHWHGIRQYGNSVQDGPTGFTQCPVAPNSSIKYEFDVYQAGTYWYHSHNFGQYPDGLRAPFIVHDDDDGPYAGQYDEELILTMSDWYHDQMPGLVNNYQSTKNNATTDNGITAPVADAGLYNEQSDAKIYVKPGKTYLVRTICHSNYAGVGVQFLGHNITAVEVDGVYTQPQSLGSKQLRLAPGQRWSFLMKTKNDTSQNYPIFGTLDINMLFPPTGVPTVGYNANMTAWLVYDDTKPYPPAPVFPSFDFFDDWTLKPYDKQPILEPDHKILMDTGYENINGIARAVINNMTYLPQKVPSLYTAISVGNYSSNPSVYGDVVPFVLKFNETVEIIVNNNHNNLHPWHLHGHDFQVIQRGDPSVGPFSGYWTNVSSTPMKRDTIMANKLSNVVLRFRADNPGVWAFHCHIEWHIESGLAATIIEAPEYLSNITIPPSHKKVCEQYGNGMQTAGNAAGNTRNPLNLTGANDEVLQYAQG
ncbi:MAG: hypothetical protein Q9191_006661, partial [Dirinaria sp. TL-2023a]